MNAEAVLFDLGDTLFRLLPVETASAYVRFAEVLAERTGLPPGQARDVAKSIGRALDNQSERLYQDCSTAEPSVAATAEPLLSRFGADAAWLAGTLDHLLGECDIARWDPPAGRAAEVRAFAEAGLRVAFVSNTRTPPALMRRRLREFGLLEQAHAALFSVELGERKPGERIYRAALDAIGVDARNAVFVGDRMREDVRGPQEVGMRAILTHEFRREEPIGPPPDGIIESLFEVWNFL